MKLKPFLALVLFFCVSLFYAQNSLKIPDINVGIGEKTKILIELDNSEPIIGTEFTLKVPKGLIVNEKESILTSDRKGEDHALFVNIDKNGDYHFMVFSYTNKTFKGNSGALLEIPIEIPVSFIGGQSYDISLSGVIVSSTEIKDVGTNHQGGKLIVKEGFSPDLKVSGVSVSESEIAPEETITVSWGVENIGGKTASGGWIEQISLISEKTNQKYLLGNITYEEDLNNGVVISRQAQLKIPKITGIDGNCKIEVNLIPDPEVKEPESNRENNKATSVSSVLVKKMLFIETDKKEIQENSTDKIRVTLTRSGDRSSTQTFTIKSSLEGQLSFPVTVTINAGASSAVFYMESIDNTIADGNREVKISVSGNEYPEVSSEVTIIDDEIPSFTLTLSKNNLDPGDKITVTLQTNEAPVQDVKITLETDLSQRLSFPQEVILPSGSNQISFDVEVLNTKIPEGKITAKITARGIGYKQAHTEIILNNANIPDFEFTISPSTISEGDGTHATYAVIKRLNQTDVTVDVLLKADVADALILPSKITFSPGQIQQKFNIGVVDNSIVEGTREVNVTASVFISSCQCSGESSGITGTEFTQKITILDNDGLALKVTANPSTVKAGQEKAAKITITRNTTLAEELSKPVSVKLSSDTPSIVKIPATVEIPANQVSVEVEIDTQIDTNKKGDQTIRIQAEAEGYSSGFGWILVTDQNKPDAVITLISAPEKTEGGELAEVTTQIKNQGFASLPTGMKVEYYLSSDLSLTALEPFAEANINEEIPSGNTFSFIQTLQLPEKAGKHNLIVVLNSDRRIEELTYTNNQEQKKLELIPNYTAEVKAEKKVYKPGEIISLSGSAKTLKGNIAANKPVEIKIVNDGFVRTFTVRTNASGNFAYEFIPLQGENGHYEISAGYPGTEVKTQDGFDILGVTWLNKPSDYLKWDATEGQKLQGEFRLKNNTQTPLTNIQVKLPADADFTIQTENLNLSAGQEGILKYTLTPNGASPVRKYYEIKADFISSEGAKTPFTSWYYCYTEKAKLTVEPVSINTTMVKGKSRLYELTVVNTGATEAKNIKIEIPKVDWMKLKSPQEIEKLGSSDTLKVVLELKPTEKQQLNVPLSGNLAINISNGQAVNVPFKIETVSEDKGSLQIDVVDEYTYNTESAPHVQGAKVIVRHPYTGVVVAEGITDSKGLFTAENIPEGWYSVTVTANKHDSYQNNFQIDPERTKKETVFLSYQAVSYEWNVKPTEIEDEYQVDLDVKFETNVPKPVVTIEVDEPMLDLEPGQSRMINLTVTNHGLIAANEVRISINDFQDYTLTLLTDYIDVLNPKTSVVVPVLAKRLSGVGRKTTDSGSSNCNSVPQADFSFNCGLWSIINHAVGSTIGSGSGKCSDTSIPSSEDRTPQIPNGSGIGLGWMGGFAELSTFSDILCKIGTPDCIISAFSTYIGCTGKLLGTAVSCGITAATGGFGGDKLHLAISYVGCTPGQLGCIASVISTIEACTGTAVGFKYNKNKKSKEENFVDIIYEDYSKFNNSNTALLKRLSAYINDQKILDSENFNLFLKQVAIYLDDEIPFSESQILQIKDKLKNTDISSQQIENFCQRWNQTMEAWDKNILVPNEAYPNIINKLEIKDYDRIRKIFIDRVYERGFSSVEEMFEQNEKDMQKYIEDNKETSSSVCATVTVRFSQKMTMAREAFEGTLTLNNGNETKELKEVNLNLVITDEDGNDMTHLFQINKDAFLSGSGIVGPSSSGIGTVIFIPTKEAAPTIAKSYSFGGTLSYLDPETGEKVTVKLYPVTLEVNPSPDLVLHYFMQRDIIGDDPLTEKVEPMVPAEMSLLIKNEGYGIARNVKIRSMQPEIIENKKGLLIDFEMIGSSLNGASKQLGLLEVDFGSIVPQKAMVGQWWFTSTLLGHFVEYDINVKHLSSNGNKDLSLIKDYQVHELIKSVKAYGTGQDDIPDFLVNDIPDMNDTPDMIYYSNGDSEEVSEVNAVSASNLISPSQLTTKLSVTPSLKGWNYGNIEDPGKDLYKLVKVVRNEDKQELPIENFWQTFVTLRDGKDPKYENKLHFVDKVSAKSTYTLYYTPVDTNVPEVISFENIPENGTTTQPVEYVQVNFNKPINKSTFTYKNLHLLHQGVSLTLDSKNVNIGIVNDSVFVVNIKSLTAPSGSYELTVQCAGIKDLKGNEGVEGKAVSWTQVVGELGIIQFTSDQNKSQPLNSIEIIFNKKVSPAEFTKDKLLINGISPDVEITNLAGEIKYTISGLQQYNKTDGTYELSVNLPDMKAGDGSQGLIIQTFKWKVDRVFPEVESFELQYQGAVHTQNVTDVLLTLNKPIVTDFKPEWISLYQGSTNQNITVSINKQDELHYLISGLGNFTITEAGYKLVVNQEEFVDEAGNYGMGTTSKNWTVSFGKPLAVADMQLIPDRGISSTDHITSGEDVRVSVKTVEDKRTVALYVISPAGESLIREVYQETAGTIEIPVGNHKGRNTFKAIVYDSFGNASDEVLLEAYIDAVDLGASLSSVFAKGQQGNCSELESVKVSFTDDIVISELTTDALLVKAGGVKIPAEEIAIIPISEKEVTISNLQKLRNNGDITIGIDLSYLHKKLSGLQGTGIKTIELGEIKEAVEASISGSLTSSVNKTTSYVATPGMNQYKWSVTGGIIIQEQDNEISVSWTEKGEQTLTLEYQTPELCDKTTSIRIEIDDLLSIDDTKLPGTDRLTLTPVPNEGRFTLLMKGKEGMFNLYIYDISGRKIYSEEKVKVSHNFVKEVDLRPVSSGVYYLVLHNSNHTYKVKFIVN